MSLRVFRGRQWPREGEYRIRWRRGRRPLKSLPTLPHRHGLGGLVDVVARPLRRGRNVSRALRRESDRGTLHAVVNTPSSPGRPWGAPGAHCTTGTGFRWTPCARSIPAPPVEVRPSLNDERKKPHMNRPALGFGAIATSGTKRSAGDRLHDRLARIVRRSERKNARVAKAHRVSPYTTRNGDPLDGLRRAGLI